MFTFQSLQRSPVWILVALAPFLLTPSLPLWQKLSTRWAALYFVTASALLVLFWASRRSLFDWLDRLPTSRIVVCTVALFVGFAVVYSFAYPLANARNAVGGGSDTDEAVNASVHALLNGEYPYYAKTYLGNPFSGMPGAILLAVPFVALGNSTYQNFFWLAVFFVASAWRLADLRIAFVQFLSLAFLAPAVLHSLVTGNDLFANCLFVLIAMLACVGVAERLVVGWPTKIFVAVFLGIAFSSRSNFLLLLPLLARYLVQLSGWRTMSFFAVTGGIVFLAVTLPFWIYDPSHFGPTLKQNIFRMYLDVLPQADKIIPGCNLLLALALAVMPGELRAVTFWRRCALIQMFPVVAITMLHVVSIRWPSTHWLLYGQIYMFFGSLAFWLELDRNRSPGKVVQVLAE